MVLITAFAEDECFKERENDDDIKYPGLGHDLVDLNHLDFIRFI